MSHRLHPATDALLFDGCEECEGRTEFPAILEIDVFKMARLWNRMIDVEFFADQYRTLAEAKAGRTLYHLYVLLERFGKVGEADRRGWLRV